MACTHDKAALLPITVSSSAHGATRRRGIHRLAILAALVLTIGAVLPVQKTGAGPIGTLPTSQTTVRAQPLAPGRRSGWKIVNANPVPAFMAFPDAQHGWAVGYGGSIVHTADGGATWQPQESGTVVDLNGVVFTDDHNGWAIGGNGTILHTADGGATWQTQYRGGYEYLTGIAFTDAHDGWVVGWASNQQLTTTRSLILHTTDGGSTWQEQQSGLGIGQADLGAVTFANARDGWIVTGEGAIIATRDGGSTWERQNGGISGTLNSVSFVDAHTGWTVGNPQSGPGSVVLHTANGGATWQVQYSKANPGIFAVSFITTRVGWALATTSDKQGQSTGYSILHTANGGRSWSTQRAMGSDQLSQILFTDARNGWVVDTSGALIRTTDGGATWKTVSAGLGAGLRAVVFPTAQDGWAVGAGTIMRTTDQGATWQQQDRLNAGLMAITFSDVHNGWIVGWGEDRQNRQQAVLLHSRDGGASWHSAWNNTDPHLENAVLNDVAFTDPRTGWAVGTVYNSDNYATRGVILHTTDGGNTWHLQQSNPLMDLGMVYFVNAKIGLVAGSTYDSSGNLTGNAILHTINGGASWQVEADMYGIRSVVFANSREGWAGVAGGILHTTNAGKSWQKQLEEPVTLGSYATVVNKMAFLTTREGWAVGAGAAENGGVILHTSDGGATWQRVRNGLDELWDVACTSQHNCWIVGEHGIILHITAQ